MRHRSLTLAAGAALIVPASLGLLLSGVPTTVCPFPLVTVMPAFVLGRAYWLAVLVPTLLFFAWSPGLFRGQNTIPKRSFVLLALLTSLTVLYFLGSWKYGIEYQGSLFTHSVCVVNVLWLLLLWSLFLWKLGRSSFAENLSLHWILFAWLAWYAFPYLGELP